MARPLPPAASKRLRIPAVLGLSLLSSVAFSIAARSAADGDVTPSAVAIAQDTVETSPADTTDEEERRGLRFELADGAASDTARRPDVALAEPLSEEDTASRSQWGG